MVVSSESALDSGFGFALKKKGSILGRKALFGFSCWFVLFVLFLASAASSLFNLHLCEVENIKRCLICLVL